MNETQVTAYALNELQGGERDKFESDLAADQDLQRSLELASRVADGLAQVMSEPGEGLDPQAREKLLRVIAENQDSFRKRRKILRLAVPVSLAAAASIAVLLWVAGGMTEQWPAVAAAGGAGTTRAKTAAPLSRHDPAEDERFSVRTIHLSESARTAQQMRDHGGLSLTPPAVRTKRLLWNEDLPMWSDSYRN